MTVWLAARKVLLRRPKAPRASFRIFLCRRRPLGPPFTRGIRYPSNGSCVRQEALQPVGVIGMDDGRLPEAPAPLGRLLGQQVVLEGPATHPLARSGPLETLLGAAMGLQDRKSVVQGKSEDGDCRCSK